MKVPSGKAGGEPSPTYDKDRSLTRRTVAGAAGGMKGVDYEDDRRADPTTVKATAGAGSNRAQAQGREALAAAHLSASAAAGDPDSTAPVKEEAEMVLDDEDAATRDAKARQRAKHFVPRDRFTVDKDAPTHGRKVRWDLLDDEEEDDEDARLAETEEAEVDLAAIAEAIASADDEDRPRAHLFAKSKTARPGDPGLVDPETAMRRLGSPLAYAHHALLLSEAFRQTTGATRAEAVAYLAELFVAVPDPAFGRSALRELGPGTGIVEIYPLEVIAHILERFPGFLTKVSFAPFLVRLEEDAVLALEPYRALELELPEALQMRGFAIVGGLRPGYRFEPSREPGRYRLVMGAVGEYELLLSARAPNGNTQLERVQIRVEGVGPQPIARDDPPRLPEKVAAWPRPRVVERWRKPSPRRKAPKKPKSHELSAAERLSRGQMDALRGPKGETELFAFRGLVDEGWGPRRSEAVQAAERSARARAGLDEPTEAPRSAWESFLAEARAEREAPRLSAESVPVGSETNPGAAGDETSVFATPLSELTTEGGSRRPPSAGARRTGPPPGASVPLPAAFGSRAAPPTGLPSTLVPAEASRPGPGDPAAEPPATEAREFAEPRDNAAEAPMELRALDADQLEAPGDVRPLGERPPSEAEPGVEAILGAAPEPTTSEAGPGSQGVVGGDPEPTPSEAEPGSQGVGGADPEPTPSPAEPGSQALVRANPEPTPSEAERGSEAVANANPERSSLEAALAEATALEWALAEAHPHLTEASAAEADLGLTEASAADADLGLTDASAADADLGLTDATSVEAGLGMPEATSVEAALAAAEPASSEAGPTGTSSDVPRAGAPLEDALTGDGTSAEIALAASSGPESSDAAPPEATTIEAALAEATAIERALADATTIQRALADVTAVERALRAPEVEGTAVQAAFAAELLDQIRAQAAEGTVIEPALAAEAILSAQEGTAVQAAFAAKLLDELRGDSSEPPPSTEDELLEDPALEAPERVGPKDTQDLPPLSVDDFETAALDPLDAPTVALDVAAVRASEPAPGFEPAVLPPPRPFGRRAQRAFFSALESDEPDEAPAPSGVMVSDLVLDVPAKEDGDT